MIGEKGNKDAAEKLAKEQELQKIHVKKEDVEVIVSKQGSCPITLGRHSTVFLRFIYLFQINELLIPRQQAEKVLREHRGDVVKALISLTN